jgi:hypothetical protein
MPGLFSRGLTPEQSAIKPDISLEKFFSSAQKLNECVELRFASSLRWRWGTVRRAAVA